MLTKEFHSSPTLKRLNACKIYLFKSWPFFFLCKCVRFSVVFKPNITVIIFCSPQFSSVQSLSRVRLCDPMNRSTPGLPVHHQLPEFTQTHIHRVSDAIQPSHPLSSSWTKKILYHFLRQMIKLLVCGS